MKKEHNNLIKNSRYEIIIFCVEAVGMILEIVASRILSPYFGSSNIVWTSIIGIILLSGSIGNYVGGKIADKDGIRENLKTILLMTGMFIFIIPFIQKNILDLISEFVIDTKIGAILGATILFLIPSIFIGLITPIILKLRLNSLEKVGIISGKIYAISTLGGIFGTFLGGFLLVPNIGSVYILFVLSIVMFILIPIVDLKIKDKINIAVVSITIVCIVLMNIFIAQNNSIGNKILKGDTDRSISLDTQYGRVLIYNTKIDNENVRVLNIDSGYESATYTDEDKVYDLVFNYTKYYDLMFKANINISDTMLIGGAGYSYPKYYISNYQDKNMDVIEIDGDITKIAKEYFYLDRLIDEYNLEQNNRLNLITEDGRVYINNTQKKYDAILNDAFSGISPAKTLTTIEAVTNIKKSLNEDGVYLTNIISSLDGENSKFIKAEINTLKQVFKNVYVVPCSDINDTEIIQNNMIIASDDGIDLESTFNLEISDDEIIITDDYCPVDTLVPQSL